jgi:hypothetical protein
VIRPRLQGLAGDKKLLLIKILKEREMKKTFMLVGTILFLAGVQLSLADSTSSSGSASPTPSTTPGSSSKHHKKKTSKATAQPTGTVTPSVSPTVSPSLKTAAMPTAVPTKAPMSAISSTKIYDRLNMPGDLRRALSLAVKTLDSSKHGRTVFLALDKVSSNKEDQDRKGSYARVNIETLEFGGPKNPWILVAGTVYEQKGGDVKVGDPIELAVDFKDIKIDYEGTKLGQIQKGNDIAGQVYETLNSHGSYQWVLEANDQVKDQKYQDDTPAYLIKARDGYALLDFLHSPEASH